MHKVNFYCYHCAFFQTSSTYSKMLCHCVELQVERGSNTFFKLEQDCRSAELRLNDVL
jgi:hypothetical protein